MKPTFRKFTVLLVFFCSLAHLRLHVTSEQFTKERFRSVDDYYNDLMQIIEQIKEINLFYVLIGIILCAWTTAFFRFCKMATFTYRQCVRKVQRFRRSQRRSLSQKYRNRRLVYRRKK